MFRPRSYLSFSQMTTFEQDKDRFLAQYVHGERQRITRNMKFGADVAEALENGESSGDPFLDLMMAKLPKLDRMDKPVEDPKGREVYYERDKKNYFVPVLENKGDDIPLLAVPDSAAADYSAFKEYKTSVRKWTQKMVDDSGQITFYATAMWLNTGKIPSDIELANVQLDYDENGHLMPTGDVWCFPTKRTMVDVIRMTNRIRKAWHEINELCKKELL